MLKWRTMTIPTWEHEPIIIGYCISYVAFYIVSEKDKMVYQDDVIHGCEEEDFKIEEQDNVARAYPPSHQSLQ